MKAFLKKYAFGLISGSLSLGVVLFFAISTHGLGDLFEILLGANSHWLLAAMGCMVGFWTLEATILHIFTVSLAPKYRFSFSLINTMVGQLYNALTPFATGGQFMQVVYMGRSGLTAGASTAVLAMRTLVYHVVLALYAVLSVIIGAAYISAVLGALWVLLVVGLLVNLGVATAMWLIQNQPKAVRAVAVWGMRVAHKLKLIRKPDEHLVALNNQITLFHDSTMVFAKNRPAVIGAYFISFIQMTFFFAVPYCIYRALWYQGTPVHFMVATQSIVSMISAFVPLPGSSGGAEGSFALMFSRFFSEGDIMPAMLLWRIITYYSCVVIGGLIAISGERFIRRRAAAGTPALETRPRGPIDTI